MSFNPLVSIIIPVYNGSDYLDEAIISAISQTYTNIETIVVNDGSNDGGLTQKIALKYQKEIHYYEKPNGGVSSAFNFGIDRMKGEYFSWLSHDDVYYPCKIEKQIEYLKHQEDKEIILYSQTNYIDEKSNIIFPKGRPPITKEHTRNTLFSILLYRPLINGNTILIPKTCFKKSGYFNESLKTSQDYDLWFRMAKYFEFHFIEDKLVKTRIHSKQGSSTNKHFIEESKRTKINQINILGVKYINELSEENSETHTMLKIALKYIINGGDNLGWPVEYIKNTIITSGFNKAIISIISLLMRYKISRKITKTLFKNRLKFKCEIKPRS